MDTLDIEILTYISPHLFYVSTDIEANHNFLQNVSVRIKKGHLGSQHSSSFVDEVVAVKHGSDLVRATVLETLFNEETHGTLYFCWLVDFAVLIKTDTILRLPKDLQKITPRCKQASLNNICYLREYMELGVTGTIKTVPSIVPSSGVVQYSLELLADADKIIFEVAERFDNILIGEVVIHKKGKVLYLTEELCNKKLLVINELMFQNLKYSTKEYMKTHLEMIHQVCKKKSPKSPEKSSFYPTSAADEEMEELEISSVTPLENGRRRRGLLNRSTTPSSQNATTLNKSDAEIINTVHKENVVDVDTNNIIPTSASTSDQEQQQVPKTDTKEADQQQHTVSPPPKLDVSPPILDVSSPKSDVSPPKMEGTTPPMSKTARLLLKVKARASPPGEATKVVPKENVKVTKPPDAMQKVAEFMKRKHAAAASSCSNRSDEDSHTSDSGSVTQENPSVQETPEEAAPVSPFASITSQRTNKPRGIFLPAGMERSMTSRKSNSPKTTPKQQPKIKESVTRTKVTSTPKAAKDEDCPTIKIPKAFGSLTDDQLTAEEGEEDKSSSSNKMEESSSSETVRTDMFTKQDFHRVMGGGCTCLECKKKMENDDWDMPIKFSSDGTEEVKKKSETKDLIIKPPRLLKPEGETEEGKKGNEILSIDYQGMSTMEKKMSCKVLVHGESIPIPIKHVAQVNIHREIYNNISRINYKESKRIQHYVFPAITRNQHVFMVNDQNSGKTMAYLPILMSFVMEKEQRYSQLFKMGGGPMVVILCSNSKKCEEVHDMTRKILERQNRKCSLVTYPGYGNISNIDILVTMPTVLAALRSNRATDFKRLCHLVLEDADVILKSHNDLIGNFLNYADQVLEHRNCPKSIQLILCAQHWTVQLENILTKLNTVPMVCIGNHLEAALYGKMKFTMKFLDTACKEQKLQNVLHDKFKFTKTVVLCNPDELDDVQTFLTLKGIDFTSFMDSFQEEDILYVEAVWNNAPPGRYSVLVCTDDIYNTMNVTSAHLLVHYSLPHTWTQFIRRFSCLLENVQTPLDDNQKTMQISSFVFIDENCEPRMSKFSNFIKIAGLEKELPEKIKLFFEGVAMQEEHKRVTRKTELCQTLKIFGKCDSLYCQKRHLLDKNVDDSSDILPKNGTLRFQILKMTSAGSCSIRLLELFDLRGTSVRTYENSTNDIADILALKNNYHHVSKPIVTHLYLHKEQDKFFRCKLIELDDFALVYLIDRGIYCKCGLTGLFKMPEELKQIPPQSYEVHFANLIPPYQDNRFSRMAGRKAQFLVDSNCPDSVMSATVTLRLGNNLWLDDVYEHLEMHDKSFPSIGFQLTRELVKQGLAVKSTKPMEQLYRLCKEADIELPEYNVAKPTIKKVKVDQVQPNWAFLDTDAIHEVTFTFATDPNEYYVRQNKFSKQLQQLEEVIQKEIRRPFYPTPKTFEVGKCYLVKDQETGDFARGMILRLLDEENAEILNVDYGDVVIDKVSALKHISNDLILRLPFQSVQCSMYGIEPVEEEWSDAATDLLYTMAHEEGTSTLRSLFIKITSKQDNPIVKRQNSYSVILKDGLSRRLLINDLLVDCGYALPATADGEDVRDFDLPEVVADSDEDDSIEEIPRSDDDMDCGRDDVESMTEGGIDFSAFECEIIDFDGFMKDIDLPYRKPPSSDSKAIEDTPKHTDLLPPIKAAPAVDYLTPIVHWSQTNEHLKLTIQISDVVNAKMVVKLNRSFQFSTTKEDKKYALNLLLYAKVESTIERSILGPHVRVTLKKCKAAEWPRLLHTQDKVRKIYYDLSTMNIPDDEDTKRHRPLQLNIEDPSSDEDDDKRPYFVCSDLDSDYDFDIPNDDD